MVGGEPRTFVCSGSLLWSGLLVLDLKRLFLLTTLVSFLMRHFARLLNRCVSSTKNQGPSLGAATGRSVKTGGGAVRYDVTTILVGSSGIAAQFYSKEAYKKTRWLNCIESGWRNNNTKRVKLTDLQKRLKLPHRLQRSENLR